MEGGIQHFSHVHPLSFFKFHDDEDPKPYLCSICRLPILSSPSYTCTINPQCNFFLHKPCANLPQKLRHPGHDPDPFRKHSLHLVPNSQSCMGFTYECERHCEYDLHPLVAVPVEIRSKHKSHPAHPLVAVRRETTSRCDACGEEQKGFFFCCHECNFWIHQECALLPSFVKIPFHPDHPFFLTYSLPAYILRGGRCLFCKRTPHLHDSGVYFCGECNSLAHLSCAKSKLQTETSLELIQLPDDGATFPSLTIGTYLKSSPVLTRDSDEDDEYNNEHILIFDEGISSTSSKAYCDSVCDICTRPIDISSPFYRCQLQSDDCHFLAHTVCANHLRREKFFFGVKALLCPGPDDMVFNSVFSCFYCRRPCNGFCYYIEDVSICYFIDVECLAAPKTIKHASHSEHVLFQATRLGLSDTSIPLSCCSGESLSFDVYRCTECNFYIHIKCALLPKWTRHKFDEHPLELITHHNKPRIEGQCCFCEFCEQDINQRYWYYGCDECQQYFHVDCIPSVGYLSKVMFGKTLVDDNIHRDHPLTLTRMLTVGRQETCGHCKKIIRGFVDEMAFHCSECDFWIHFSCARDSSPATHKIPTRRRLKVYSEVEKDYFRMFQGDSSKDLLYNEDIE